MNKDRALTGAAGEHYVAFRLTAMGYAVGLTTRGTRTVDMVVANPDTGKSVSIDTKTMKKAFGRSKSELFLASEKKPTFGVVAIRLCQWLIVKG